MTDAPAIDPTAMFFHRLIQGDLPGFLNLFAPRPAVDDPRTGAVEGEEAIGYYVEAHHDLFRRRKATAEVLNTIVGRDRSVSEWLLHQTIGTQTISFPVAVVGEARQSGKVSGFRLYYTTRPLSGTRTLRLPLFKKSQPQQLPDILGDYQRALSEGNLELVLQMFEDDGYLRNPSGEITHQGKNALRAFFHGLFALGGGIGRTPCALTDDGRSCAVEYNVVKWGKADVPAQAGIAIYERGKSGKLQAARFYDDVEPPKSASVAGTSASH